MVQDRVLVATNRKWHIGFRMAENSSNLDDLEDHWHPVLLSILATAGLLVKTWHCTLWWFKLQTDWVMWSAVRLQMLVVMLKIKPRLWRRAQHPVVTSHSWSLVMRVTVLHMRRCRQLARVRSVMSDSLDDEWTKSWSVTGFVVCLHKCQQSVIAISRVSCWLCTIVDATLCWSLFWLECCMNWVYCVVYLPVIQTRPKS